MAQVFYSTVIHAAIEQVWEVIREFGKLADWHPLIVDSQIEADQPQDRVGCIRSFHLADGANFREKLLALNDFKQTLTYSIVESPLPIENYVATMKLTRITDGNLTFVSWSSSFNCPDEKSEELINLVQNDVYAAGLNSIQERLKSK